MSDPSICDPGPARPVPGRPSDEAERLRALYRLRLDATVDEPCFNDLADLARQVCGGDLGFFCVLEEERQWVAGVSCAPRWETARDNAVCSYTITHDGPLVIADTRTDERSAGNPQMVAFGIHAYAGVAVRTPNGQPVATVGVMSFAPHDLTGTQRSSLQGLARLGSAVLARRQARPSLGDLLAQR